MDNKFFDNSIILMGPIGVGKSVLSRELSNITKMPIISLDELRFLPHLHELEKQKIFLEVEIYKLKAKNNTSIIQEKVHTLDLVNHQIALREKFINLPNYYDLGYKNEANSFLMKNFGEVAWHFYNKQFENKLFEKITKFCIENNFNPCIFDEGGGFPISLDNKYQELDKKFREINEPLYLKYFQNLNLVSFNKTQELHKNFKNIIELQFDENFKTSNEKASSDSLNDLFIQSNQYNLLSNIHITSNFIVDNKIDYNKLNNITKQILDAYIIKKNVEK